MPEPQQPIENVKSSPYVTLSRHAARLDRRLEGLEKLDRRFFYARLITLIIGLVLAFAGLQAEPDWVAPAAILSGGAAFALVVALHRRLDRVRRAFRIALRQTEDSLVRIRLDWEALPSALDVPIPAGHPFGDDLNLFGPRSLHHLLDTCQSSGGSRRLADWLLEESPLPDRSRERQELARQALARPGFRRQLALRGALAAPDGEHRWHDAALAKWLAAHPTGRPLNTALWVLGGLAVLDVLLFGLGAAGLLPPVWALSLAVYAWLTVYWQRGYEDTFDQAYELGKNLRRLRAIFEHLESYPFPPESGLGRLCAPFRIAHTRPSTYIRRLTWVASAAGLRHNSLVYVLINALLPWDLYFAHRLELIKRQLSEILPAWLDSLYELEAVNCLADFAARDPHMTFPRLLLDGDPAAPLFAGRNLGHPLIAAERRVCNDFSLQHIGEIALITGSNMSGKSTFLRTVGVNLCLAHAGGPVVAADMALAPLRLFTSIQIRDSLQDGISYFYAEVKRLKALLEATLRPDQPPVLFLIDEIFRGTNNRERHVGGQAYVRTLATRRVAGLISTHDLDLVQMSNEIDTLRNLHFREDVQDGRMQFDYRLRPGPCPTTNALKIMQMEGLPVQAPEDRD